MRQLLPILAFASLGLLGCGTQVTQADLDTTANSLREDAESTTRAVHECAMTRAYAQRSSEACERYQIAEFCELSRVWQERCVSVDDDGDLMLPEPGVMDALKAVLEETEEAAQE